MRPPTNLKASNKFQFHFHHTNFFQNARKAEKKIKNDELMSKPKEFSTPSKESGYSSEE